MNETLPIFPLRLVVFPREKLNLHIFEPRYKQLINDVSKSQSSFGIPPVIHDQVMEVGTEISLLRVVKKYMDGRMDIQCIGLHPFRKTGKTLNFDQKLYDGVQYLPISISFAGDLDKNQLIIQMLQSLYNDLKIKKALPGVDQEGLSYIIGHQLGFTPQQEYELLKEPEEAQRQDMIIDHLTAFIPSTKEKIEMRKRSMLNGQFRKYGGMDFQK